MKQIYLKLSMLLLFVMVGLNVFADEVIYTLDATDTNNQGKNNGYEYDCDVTVGDITWNVKGNATMSPWRIGGKSIDSVDRTVFSKTSFPSALTKIDLEIGSTNNIINSIKLVYSTNEDFSNATTLNADSKNANSTISFIDNFPKNAFYKFIFNVTVSSTSNKFVEFKKVVFYGEKSDDDGTDSPTNPSDDTDIPSNPSVNLTYGKFVKVANANDIISGGQYLIVKENVDGNSYAAGTIPDGKKYLSVVEISSDGSYLGDVNSENTPYVYTLESIDNGGFCIKSGGKYLTGTDGSTDLKLLTTIETNSKWNVEITIQKNVTIENKNVKSGENGRQIRYNTGTPNRFADYASSTGNVVTLYKYVPTITLNASGYATFSYASDVEISGANVYTAKIDEDKIVCTKVEGNKVPAYNGVLLYGEPSATVSILPTVNAPALNDNALKATTVEGGLATGEPAYVLSGDTFKNYTGGSFAENKAYFAQSDIQAKVISIVMDESTSINLVKETEANTPAYNLQGVRVVPSAKGFVIINGKKFYNK